MATHLHRLLLLLFLPSVLLLYCATSQPTNAGVTGTGDHRPGVYPVVLLPGSTCSQLAARLTDAYRPPSESPQCGAGSNERDRWFRLWRNMDDPGVAPCLTDQLRLVYDPAARDFRDVPGVETRVLGFGSATGFLADTEANKDLCMGRLVDALQQPAGRVPRRRDAVRRAVRLPASSRRAGAAVPSLLAVHPVVQGARGAREQGERRQAGRHRVAQPGRLLRAGVPEPEPAAVA